MSLEEYERKRDFSKTPEPAGSRRASKKALPLRFVLHRHEASHIHYDLRLEHAGTLKSWALPKGLATPHDSKKLAVHVEDHPLEYAGFEGRIPEGEYGAGTVSIWDEGTWTPLDEPVEGLKTGKLTFLLHGEKVRGEFTLARLGGSRGARAGGARSAAGGRYHGSPEGEGKEWLIILSQSKERELNPELHAEGEPAPMPARVTPMQAVLVDQAFDSPDFLFEVKFDGIRSLAFIGSDGALSLRSRNGNEQAFRYPELAELPSYLLARELVLDGEIVALDEGGVSRFQLLQGRMNLSGQTAIEAAAHETPAYYYVFDILHLNGRNLTGLPLKERKRILERVLMPHKYVRLSDWYPQQGKAMFGFARENGLEGVIAKRLSSRYVQKRTRDWLKIKAVLQQEFVIIGYTRPRRSRVWFGALLLGLYEDGELVYAGHVGTGFSDQTLADLFSLMEPLALEGSMLKTTPKTNEPAVWLEPNLVAEVKFTEWTREGLLRHPVYLGLRDDVSPRDCVRETSRSTEAVMAGTAEMPVPLAGIPGPRSGDRILKVSGREIKLTNLDKVFWPDEGYTKFDLLDYYHRVSAFVVPHLRGRPLTLKRYPNGFQGDHFFQKEAPPEIPDWVHTELIAAESTSEVTGPARRRGKRTKIRYVVCEDEASLLYIANLGCISQNPWLSTLPDIETPDIMAFDIDPADEDDFDACIETALLVRDRLAAFGLRGYPKTSGASGIHIYVPVLPNYTFEQVRQFAEMLSILCRDAAPDLITLEQPLARRTGARVYLDFRQNVKGKTLASAYSVRARPGAPVSAPLEWKEIHAGLKPSDFTIRNMPARLAEVGDLHAGVLTDRQDLLAALEEGRRFLKTG